MNIFFSDLKSFIEKSSIKKYNDRKTNERNKRSDDGRYSRSRSNNYKVINHYEYETPHRTSKVLSTGKRRSRKFVSEDFLEKRQKSSPSKASVDNVENFSWTEKEMWNNKTELIDTTCFDKKELDQCLNRVVYNQSVDGLPYTKEQLNKMCR